MLICILCVGLCANWCLEQPISSLASRHPRFQWMTTTHRVFEFALKMGIYDLKLCPLVSPSLINTLKVYVCRFWMMHYNHSCPKRSIVWSSNPHIMKFDQGPLTTEFKRNQREVHGHVQTVKKTINKTTGKASYSGSSALKGTQTRPYLLIASCLLNAWRC